MRSRSAKRLTQGLCLASVMLLAACAKGPGEPSAEVELSQAITQVIRQRLAPKPEPLVLTRALLDSQEVPHLEVRVEDQELTGYLGLLLSRRDDLPGEITHWSAADGSALIFRNGMLIASRGMAGNLLSARVPAQGLEPGPAHGGARSYQLRDGDFAARPITLACSLEDLGPVTLEIVGLRYPTRHLQERCESAGEGSAQQPGQKIVINEYWVDSLPRPPSGPQTNYLARYQTRLVRQSRQWAGPEIGYLRLRDLSR